MTSYSHPTGGWRAEKEEEGRGRGRGGPFELTPAVGFDGTFELWRAADGIKWFAKAMHPRRSLHFLSPSLPLSLSLGA
jgi:hypothetical protein